MLLGTISYRKSDSMDTEDDDDGFQTTYINRRRRCAIKYMSLHVMAIGGNGLIAMNALHSFGFGIFSVEDIAKMIIVGLLLPTRV